MRMPRKRTATAPPPAAPPPTLEERLESLTWQDEESVASRITSVAALILACDAADVQVPRSVRQSAPTPHAIVLEIHRLTALAAETDQALKVCKGYVLDYLDRPGCTGADEYMGEGGYGVKRTPGCSAEKLNPARLVELGVDPDVIDRATDSGTPYFQVRLVTPKEG